MTLKELAWRFSSKERAVGNVLPPDDLLQQAITAAIFYAGYANLAARAGLEKPYPAIDMDTEITESEWVLIRPLFLLYIERETALQLEASRGMGVDVFGRSSSEIAGDIAQIEMEFPHRAFYRPIMTV